MHGLLSEVAWADERTRILLTQLSLQVGRAAYTRPQRTLDRALELAVARRVSDYRQLCRYNTPTRR